MTLQDYTVKGFVMNILNGLAIGVVTALITSALLGVPLRFLAPHIPFAMMLLKGLQFYNSMVGLIVGVITCTYFRFTPIQMGAVAMATMFASGAGHLDPNGGAWVLAGTGDIITMGVTTAIGVLIVLAIGERVKAYTVLVIPALVFLVAGSIGTTLHPYITEITTLIGQGVAYLFVLHPLLMSVLVSVSFSAIMMSPITTVGISLAIGISGIASGAANLGICAAAFGFCTAGWAVNSKGTSLTHWLGSPKISMANVMAKPIIMLPILCNAFCMGILAYIFAIEGTAMSAGFGFSGLVGPVAAIDLSPEGWKTTNVIFIFTLFSLVPTILSLVFNFLFIKILKLVKVEDYYLEMR